MGQKNQPIKIANFCYSTGLGALLLPTFGGVTGTSGPLLSWTAPACQPILGYRVWVQRDGFGPFVPWHLPVPGGDTTSYKEASQGEDAARVYLLPQQGWIAARAPNRKNSRNKRKL